MEKDPKSPATTSDAYDHMVPLWAKVASVLGGTETMRAAGTAYLPQHEEESDWRYKERLASTTLFNVSELTLNSWVGRPFSDPPKLTVPAQIEELLEDVDLEGNKLAVFARNWFKDGLAKAFSHVYVEFPRADPTTLADDAVLRPYWIHVPPENVFFVEAQIVDGREVLSEVRMMESVSVREGFAERHLRQIRRVVRVPVLGEDGAPAGHVCQVELYRLNPKRKKEEWVLFEAYVFDLDEIPLVTFYADRSSVLCGKPPLLDLCNLNISHWQSSSDQRSILTAARFPILAVSGGIDENAKLVVGPYKWLHCPDPSGRFYYVEHTGAAISSGAEDIDKLEAKMAEYGAEFLRKRPQGETATARAMDSAEATSPLQDVTMRFEDAVANALYFTARWLKLEDGGTVEFAKDFGPEAVDQSELTALSAARIGRDLSRLAYLHELQRRGILDEEYDAEKDAAQLEQEATDLPGAPLEEEEEEEDEDEKEEVA